MVIEIPALGRPFSLGMLYDCRDDKLIPGITFWKKETLEKDVQTTSQENTCFDILASDTMADKSSALNIKTSLKASVLCSLVHVGGSANFLQDMKTSKTQARITLKYCRSTRYSQLSMNHLSPGNLSYHDGFDKGIATHVVTGILYGAQAFFIFDQDVKPEQNAMDVQGNLEAMIRKIPQIAVNAQINSTVKETVSKFNCKFHGDFALERNPVNYEDAINIYASLPKLLGDNGKKAVPVKVWLHPLSKLDKRAATLVREIGDNLVFKTESIIQQMAEVNMQCNDLMKHPVAETFPDVERKIRQFREYCEQFTLGFQKQLTQTLPSIRGGEMDEAALAEILKVKEESPFRELDITEFLRKILHEMDFIKSLLEALPKIQLVPTENKLREAVIKPDIDFTVCFNFTSLSSFDPYLLHIHDWLDMNRFTPGRVNEKMNAPHWFGELGMTRKARQYVKEFYAFFCANLNNNRTQFVVSSLLDKNNPGISIYLYEEGELINTNFKLPSQPDPMVITMKTHNTIELSLRPAELGRESIKSFRVEHKCVHDDVWLSLNVQKMEKN
ncbi:neoverrucotoxin subunit alpha-like [Pelobates fuscus]|uniref:neoverrucotoxin subunit alpha-like n=1 Tax=Pelobates fuscus TaxID=191477 RepID=UPI002FE435B9